MQVGDVVLAIGNPFGVGQTVTMGIVSALKRSHLGLSTFENFIQTDAAINPGNSGGALVDVQGNLLGINSAIYSPNGGSLGIGFAIPVSTAKKIMEQIIQNRRRVLDQFVKLAFGTLPAGLRVRAEVDLGVPYRKIIEKATAEKADLIIMSTHGWSGFLHLLIGSVTEKVVSKASCPVLSVHPLEQASAPPAVVS